MIQKLTLSLLESLGLTVALEVGIGIVTGKKDRKNLLLIVLVNIITNPVVVLSYWLAAAYTSWNLALVVAALEVFAVLLEGGYYRKYGRGFGRPYLFSAAANMFSFWVGALIQWAL